MSSPSHLPARSVSVLHADWRFHLGDIPEAANAVFDDADWRSLAVPHDWSIEGPFAENHATGGAGGFLPSGIGWYRKSFSLPSTAADHRVFVEFDGVMENSDVWINGVHLGHRPNGYVSFRYELTPHLRLGKAAENVLSVRTDTSGQPASRWYTGAGIYRPVRLILTDPLHFEAWATFVSTPTITRDSAVVRIQSRAVNQSPTSQIAALQVTVFDSTGRSVAAAESPAQTISPDQSSAFEIQVSLARPLLWDLNTPHLYRAVVRLRSRDIFLDEETVSLGIREARFEAATGFWLNGKNLKLKGACVHHDGGAFGAAVPRSIWESRLNALKRLGVNAIRTAHNPPSPEFLDLCDHLGLLVMDELFDMWTVAKNPHDYHRHFREWSQRDLRDTVRRDRNHPSVILYSAGNEIHDTPQEKLAYEILRELVAVFHSEDPTRPVTQALFRPNVSHDYDNGLADLLDVVGTNYRDLELLAAHQAKPSRKILGTEQSHERRVWLRCRDNPHHAGQFLWCGIDYLGESRAWPNVAAASGLLDKAGAIKTMAYERAALWCAEPIVRLVRRTGHWEFAPTDPGFTPLDRKQVLFADWTPVDTSVHEEHVEVYSNCEEVELLLNGHSLGSQPRFADESPRIWQVRWAAGTLLAVGRNRGTRVASDELKTAGAATQIRLSAERIELTLDWNDVVAVTAIVSDAAGVRVPNSTVNISFGLHGDGALVAVDSEDISDHAPFQSKQRTSYQGRCVAFIRATKSSGTICVTASSAGLADGKLALNVSARA